MAVTIDHAGRVVLVTGGTRGIGRRIAERFREAGATIAVCARKDPGDLPADWHVNTVDLRDAEAVQTMFASVVGDLGRLDVLVNNAGGSPAISTISSSARFTERIVALNLLAPIYCSQAAYPYMTRPEVQASGGGVIINISSIAALQAAPTGSVYAAAKAGLLNFTVTTGHEWAPEIRVNAVSVGLVRTAGSGDHYGDDEAERRIAATVGMGRMATPDDVADACLFLASPLAGYMSGSNVVLSGGGEEPQFIAAAAQPVK